MFNLISVLLNVHGVSGIVSLEVLLTLVNITSDNIYLFVHKAFYERHETCSCMVKQLETFFFYSLTPEFKEYAIQLYASFEGSAAEKQHF